GRVIGTQPPGSPPLSRHAAVQGERDRVEQRRLARAGLPMEQEQALKVVEVDLLGPGERPEGAHPEAMRSHQRSPPSCAALAAAKASASSAHSASLASVLRTCRTNSAAIVMSSRPLTFCP